VSILKRSSSITVVFALLLVLVTAVGLARDLKPGVERWPIKTAAPTTSSAKTVPLEKLLSLQDVPGVRKNDPRYQSARIPQFIEDLREGELIATAGWLHLVAAESDGDYHIQISTSATDGSNCFIVEVPIDDPTFVTDAAVRQAANTVREWFKQKVLSGRDPSPAGSAMQHPVYIEVVGALFYDDAHVGDPPRGKKGMKAATLWELHPLTSIRFVPIP
jgi:hypothetical protein